MATVIVSARNTRVNASDSATGWSNWGGGGPSPASEAQLRYQGLSAVNRKVTTAFSGIQYDPGAGALDMTAPANRLWLVKTYIADFGDLNATFGVKLGIGSGSGALYSYNVAGTAAKRSRFTAYPSQGGYLILALDPNVAAWRDATTGTPLLALVDYFGVQASFVVGGAKSENVALDAIDIGTGLTLTRGDGASSAGRFQDFIDADEGVVENRWGYASSRFFQGTFEIGDSAGTNPTEFTDTTGVVVFPDGYHSAGLFGVKFNLENAADLYACGATIIGLGSAAVEDTRPDFIASGTLGSLLFTGTLRNHRNATFTSACVVEGAVIECELLTQGSAEIVDSRIRTSSVASVACLKDPTFGAAGFHDSVFVQNGAGHALEIAAAGSYAFTNLDFIGYGANDSDAAALGVTALTGTVTITLLGTPQPTYKTAGAAVVFVANAVETKVTVKDISTGAAIQGARVLLLALDGTGDLPFEESVTAIVRAGSTATVTHASHGLATGDIARIQGANQAPYNGAFPVTVLTPSTYTYAVAGAPATPATGTILATGGIFNKLTDASGEVADVRGWTGPQPVEGRVRKSTAAPYYKSAPLAGTISPAAGLEIIAQLVGDD